jgi:Uma2 family endonuclease
VVEHPLGKGEVVSSILTGSTIRKIHSAILIRNIGWMFRSSAISRIIAAIMTAVPKRRMTVDEYLAWAQEQPERYELRDGTIFAMSPEGAGHAEKKAAVHAVLLAGIRARGLACYALPDGMTVRIDEATAYEPDALVYCGSKLPPSAIEVPNPVVVVEVLSPSTRHIDLSAKLADYFRLPSVVHYLIVDPEKPRIVHHARAADDTILTRIVTDGSIKLDPPGIEFAMAEVYPA